MCGRRLWSAAVTDAVRPSGQQHEIRHGDQRAVIVEVGGGLRIYETEAGPVLDGYRVTERCDGGRGQPLMPWPNRLRDGRYAFNGRPQQLPLTEPESATAIHGLVRWANWAVAEHDRNRVVVGYRLHPQPGWPGTLDLRIDYRLDDDGLTVAATALNVGPEPCPFGAGFHPYVGLGAGAVDTLTLRLPVRTRLEADERGLPCGRAPVAGTGLDYREPRPIGQARLDGCFTDLVRDPDGRARVRVATPERAVTVWADEAFGYLMVFTGDTLAPDRRRRGVAIEPMSCPPNALASGEAIVVLEPGGVFSGSWGISTSGPL
ncbi:MAG: aldose 1-epimerase [Solirubrobacteraceae bacterium]|nr:aldose 1-epimerase [Solirubrobacteraceae bacterium]